MESTIIATRGFARPGSVLLYNLKIYLLRPFIAGVFGFIIALTTLAVTYFIATEFFNTGYFAIDAIDIIIAFVIGFVPLSIYFSPKTSESDESE